MPLLIVALLGGPSAAPEDRALDYLVREVPAWSAANKCFSCHNNGDGARTLFTATRLGYRVPERALADTARWLSKPAGWDHNGGDQPFNDRHLARLQFALALMEGIEAGRIHDRQPLLDAAALIASRQHRDGYWPIGPHETPGSSTTRGTALATADARRLLACADPTRYAEAIRRADAWLCRKPVQTVWEASAVLLALEKRGGDNAASQRRQCLTLLRKGEAKDGGWGPYVNSAPEVFDTALTLLALCQQPQSEEIRAWLRHGRAFLLKTQQQDGSWPETTRPSGEDSYAERISTTAWALRALLATH